MVQYKDVVHLFLKISKRINTTKVLFLMFFIDCFQNSCFHFCVKLASSVTLIDEPLIL